jgi:hypothetical protein
VKQRWIGRWLVVVGALHTLLGLIVFAAPLRELIGAGWLNVLGSRDPMRSLAFWFLFGGVFICLVGYLIDWIERLPGAVLPRPVGWTLLITATVGVMLAPVSGFWLAFPAAIGAFVQRRRAAQQPRVM